MLHITCRESVECKCRSRADIGQSVFQRRQLSPVSNGIRHNDIRLQIVDLFRHHLIQRQRGRNQHLHGKRLILAHAIRVFLVFHLEAVAVAGEELRTGIFYLFAEHFK